MKEEYLLTGPLEPTNRPYAVAKIAGIEQCWSYNRQHGTRYLATQPTNLYGPGDSYDLARACVFLMDLDDEKFSHLARPEACPLINMGYGEELSIAELARVTSEVVGYTGQIRFDTAKPDGTPRKLLDSSRLLALGWRPKVGLKEGIARAYADFQRRFG